MFLKTKSSFCQTGHNGHSVSRELSTTHYGKQNFFFSITPNLSRKIAQKPGPSLGHEFPSTLYYCNSIETSGPRGRDLLGLCRRRTTR
ncbi:hypothetical protein CDAR_90281 [Caerostris darwini]|uniref:Uncharacterized protein n=1 Tax=Caerostris darwini TaxID=1538125 RepID=A0AAV4NQT7_9ARAC|nr:hypothetical protein CDAR_90281 [Caerostris darwini]